MPLIASLRPPPIKVCNTFSTEVYQLILPAEVEQESSEEPSSTSFYDYSSDTEDD